MSQSFCPHCGALQPRELAADTDVQARDDDDAAFADRLIEALETPRLRKCVVAIIREYLARGGRLPR